MGLVKVEKKGPVTTIIINRHNVRNAVNRPTAEALAKAFREFEADTTAKVAILCGAGGTFCAGADLKSVSQNPDATNILSEKGDGPMGPSRMMLSKPLIGAISGTEVSLFILPLNVVILFCHLFS